MAKRKHEASEPIDPAAVSVETGTPEPLFELGTWKGRTQWRCRRCPWDTLAGEAAMLAHIQNVHEPPLRPPSPPLVAVADRWGREVPPAAPTAADVDSADEQDRGSRPAEEE